MVTLLAYSQSLVIKFGQDIQELGKPRPYHTHTSAQLNDLVLNDLLEKNPGVTETNEILTPTNIKLLDNAEDIANHFNCHFAQIGP